MTSETREKINHASIIIDNAMYCDDDKSLRVIGRLYYGGKEYGVGITETKEKPDTLEIRTPETCLTYSGEFPIVKDTTPNMMNPRLYTTSYNKP